MIIDFLFVTNEGLSHKHIWNFRAHMITLMSDELPFSFHYLNFLRIMEPILLGNKFCSQKIRIKFKKKHRHIKIKRKPFVSRWIRSALHSYSNLASSSHN